MHDRGHLLTEQRHPSSAGLDTLPLADAFDLMNREDASIAAAVAAAKPSILAAIELVSDALARDGRLIYVGAGTSGRLGVLDAAECPPTFLIPPDRVLGIIAGGREALWAAQEGAEDDADAGRRAVDEHRIGTGDVVFGIATGGTTPFVHAALDRSRERGAATVFLACVPRDEAADRADVSIRVLTGPEVLTGSTRLKAGLATKMVLNTVSTLAMVRLGKVYENLMVDVAARACDKLRDRAVRTLMAAAGLPRDAAQRLLDQADWHVKTAIVMHRLGIAAPEAQRRLALCAGSVRRAIRAG
ncbi:MAG: N-acetylmuramic acid 6-phosphate etherase [Phycisphaerae bacterium]|nr:N-acetylmuramic acid 6-phosphate etherase [Phycisphaerae bacterium]MCZ2399101.1 N-acetylmuramic acid 6-phosphate etherase [Phycisphaerae bacterium]